MSCNPRGRCWWVSSDVKGSIRMLVQGLALELPHTCKKRVKITTFEITVADEGPSSSVKKKPACCLECCHQKSAQNCGGRENRSVHCSRADGVPAMVFPWFLVGVGVQSFTPACKLLAGICMRRAYPVNVAAGGEQASAGACTRCGAVAVVGAPEGVQRCRNLAAGRTTQRHCFVEVWSCQLPRTLVQCSKSTAAVKVGSRE